MKPRVNTDGHGWGTEIVSAVRTQLTGSRIVVTVSRQLAGRRGLSPHCGDN